MNRPLNRPITLSPEVPAPTVPENRGLILEEPLLFELGQEGRCGVDIPEVAIDSSRLGGLVRHSKIG